MFGKLYEFLFHQDISYYSWLFLLLGGILPDVDLVVDWIMGVREHRHFTHSLLFMLVAPVIVYVSANMIGLAESFSYAFFLGTGIMTHLILDTFSDYGISLLWPKKLYFSFFTGITRNRPENSLLHAGEEKMRHYIKLMVIDMAIGTLWIFYLLLRGMIKF